MSAHKVNSNEQVGRCIARWGKYIGKYGIDGVSFLNPPMSPLSQCQQSRSHDRRGTVR